MIKKTRDIKLHNYVCYGLADVIGSGAFTLVSAWLLFFLTTFCGLTPIEAGSLFAVARIVDVIMCPLMGYISDNFHKTRLGRRFGRRRFFLLLSIPLVSVYSLLWVEGFNYWMYLLVYILFEVVYSMIIIPYDTLSAEMTSDFTKRSKLTSARMYIAQLAGFAAAFLPGRLVSYFGSDSADSFFYAGAIFTVSFMVVLFFVYFGTWERSLEEIELNERKIDSQEKPPLATRIYDIYYDFVSTLKIKTFRSHLGMYLGGSVAQDIFNSVFTYFVVFALMTSSVMASNLLGMINGLQFFGVGLATWLTLRFSPSRAFATQGALALLAFALFAAVGMSGSTSIVLLYLAAGIAGLARGGIYAIPWNNYTFVADVDEILTCNRREGIFAGFMSLLRKASQALSIFLVGAALQMSGFVSGQNSQPESAINMIMIIMIVLPVILTLWGIWSAFQFKVNGRTHAILNEEVARLKRGESKESVSAENKAVIESLTGLPYEQCWGENEVGHVNLRHLKEQQSVQLHNA
ncbi:MFS transporter [Citrobacter amalonaticus]|uniref:MFS transporter n=1 Tax=Citrobacter amalonaticus TaxID=35703 RepID=A0A2S4S2Z7_CITAM|nr:MFS transporter [Citrobacter amalonaticus]POT59656.1 MFS transporter [Citrobacter amalonaticus]POT77786.1 MFS transporter [Citrobacter amalonaticus]POU68238.1 MFS transporter [Citrobacter amalonaticus]POV07841.1 MFS transporter [Citrobacter amalonaticus]